MKPVVLLISCLLILGNLSSTLEAVVLDKMDDAKNFYMYDAKQTGLTLTQQKPGYIVLTKAKGGENFIRWSMPGKQPIKIGQYDTLEIDCPDFGSDTKLQIMIEFFNNGRGGKGVSGAKTLVKGFSTREKKTLKFNIPDFAQKNGVTRTTAFVFCFGTRAMTTPTIPSSLMRFALLTANS